MSNIYLPKLMIDLAPRDLRFGEDDPPPQDRLASDGGDWGSGDLFPSENAARPSIDSGSNLLSDQFMESIRQAKDTPSEAPAVRPASARQAPAPKTHTMTIMNGPDIREFKFQQQPDGTYRIPEESKSFSDNPRVALGQIVEEMRRLNMPMKFAEGIFDNYQKAMLDDRRIRESELKENRMFDRQKQLQDERISAQNDREDEREKRDLRSKREAAIRAVGNQARENLKSLGLPPDEQARVIKMEQKRAAEDFDAIYSYSPSAANKTIGTVENNNETEIETFRRDAKVISELVNKAMGKTKDTDIPNITDESILAGYEMASRLPEKQRGMAFKRLSDELTQTGKKPRALNLFSRRYIGSSNYNNMPEGAGPITIGRDRGWINDTFNLTDPRTGQRVSGDVGVGYLPNMASNLLQGIPLAAGGTAGASTSAMGTGLSGGSALPITLPIAAASGAAIGKGLRDIYDAFAGNRTATTLAHRKDLGGVTSTPEEARNMGIFLQYLLNNGNPPVNP